MIVIHYKPICSYHLNQLILLMEQDALILIVFVLLAFPDDGPRIEGLRPLYSVGEFLEANCTAKMTFPLAQVTWFINNLEVSTNIILHNT